MVGRAQQTSVLHSDRVTMRLSALTHGGRTPESVVEKACDRLPERRRPLLDLR